MIVNAESLTCIGPLANVGGCDRRTEKRPRYYLCWSSTRCRNSARLCMHEVLSPGRQIGTLVARQSGRETAREECAIGRRSIVRTPLSKASPIRNREEDRVIMDNYPKLQHVSRQRPPRNNASLGCCAGRHTSFQLPAGNRSCFLACGLGAASIMISNAAIRSRSRQKIFGERRTLRTSGRHRPLPASRSSGRRSGPMSGRRQQLVPAVAAWVLGRPLIFPSLGPSAFALVLDENENRVRRVVGGHLIGVLSGLFAYHVLAHGLTLAALSPAFR